MARTTRLLRDSEIINGAHDTRLQPLWRQWLHSSLSKDDRDNDNTQQPRHDTPNQTTNAVNSRLERNVSHLKHPILR
jgi:hypothetical protein